MIILPEKVPEKGFYYHYKHDPIVGIHHYAYEVVGFSYNSDDACPPDKVLRVIYRPLYESAPVYVAGRLFDDRECGEWMSMAEHNGILVRRFTKITDPAVIAELEKICKKMYP